MKDQKYLALDLELNQPSGKIIQVGIAIGSPKTKFENFITKKWYIDPKEPISKEITELTGITDSDIGLYGQSHEAVARELSDIIKQHGTWINPITWGGGDMPELLNEFQTNQVEFHHFGRRWIDTKTFYSYLMLSKCKNPSGGLSSAMGYFKLQFKGKAHRADIDAANTLAFYFTLLDRQNKLENLASYAKEI